MKNAYEVRIVRYDEIHKTSAVHFDKLFSIIAPSEGERILDAGAGYGEVTIELLKRAPLLNAHFHLLENCRIQLNRAMNELSKLTNPDFYNNNLSFDLGSMVNTAFEDEKFDKIVAKLVLHEISKELKQAAVNEMYRLLKKQGRFIVWQTVLDDDTCSLFNNIIRRKDELAGFQSMAENRYFMKESELCDFLEKAGFNDFKKEYEFDYNFNTETRLKSEFNGDVKLLQVWNEYITGMMENEYPETLKSLVKLNCTDSNVNLLFRRAIYSAVK